MLQTLSLKYSISVVIYFHVLFFFDSNKKKEAIEPPENLINDMWRLRSAYACAQYDQSLCCWNEASKDPRLSMGEIMTALDLQITCSTLTDP